MCIRDRHNTKDQHQKAHRNIKIFTHRVKIFREWFLAAFVDLTFHIAPAEDPEEHDPCKSCAERTDIDGKHIHPVRNNALDQQRSYNADHGDHHAGRNPAKTCFFLNCGNRSFIKVHKRGHACKEYSYEKDDGNDPSARHGFDQVRQVDEQKSGTCLLYTSKYGEDKNQKIITGLKRISKPGLRVYAGKDELPKVLGGLGIAILSTNKGVITDKEARKLQVGGEVLAFVW